jgi:hypothetical protein
MTTAIVRIKNVSNDISHMKPPIISTPCARMGVKGIARAF